MVIPTRFVEGEFRGEIKNQYSNGNGKKKKSLGIMMRHVEQDIYQSFKGDSIISGLILTENKRRNGFSYRKMGKKFKRDPETIRCQISRITGKKRTPEFLEKAEEIRTFCYDTGLFNKKDIMRSYDLSMAIAKQYIDYLCDKYEDFENQLYNYSQLLMQDSAFRTHKIRKTPSWTKNRKKRKKDILSIVNSKPPKTYTIDDLKKLLNKKGYNIKRGTVQQELSDLRKDGHILKFKIKKYVRKQRTTEDMINRIEKIKEIFDSVGYIPRSRLADILHYPRKKIANAIERTKVIDNEFFKKFKEEERKLYHEMRNNYLVFEKEAKKSGICSSIEKKGFNLGQYWFNLKVIENNSNFKVDEEIIEIINEQEGVPLKYFLRNGILNNSFYKNTLPTYENNRK